MQKWNYNEWTTSQQILINKEIRIHKEELQSRADTNKHENEKKNTTWRLTKCDLSLLWVLDKSFT